MAASAVTILDGTGASKTLATFTDAAGNQRYQISGDSAVTHYMASKSQLTPVAAPTAAFVVVGSATTTVRIKRIILNGVSTSAGSIKFSIKKSSDAGTLGSAALTTITAAPLDSTNAAVTGVASSVGTANYTTLPASVGAVYSGELQLGVVATGAFAPVTVEFGTNGTQALVLRGVAQTCYVDFLGTTLPSGALFDFTVLWSEDAS